MITSLEGTLVSISAGRARVKMGDLTYEVLVPASDEQALHARVDERVTFETLHYLESQGQGLNFIPRLIGFRSEFDREFFQLFTTVKGLGNRKALRAIALPVPVIAEAIAGKDLDTLKTLPEIGKRTAETIVAELSGKVDRFVEAKPIMTAGGAAGSGSASSELITTVMKVLMQLGESRIQARALVDRVLAVHPEVNDFDELLEAVYRIRGT